MSGSDGSADHVTNSVEVEECPKGGSGTVDVCLMMPSSSTLEQLFYNRYTVANESFAKISGGFDPVICIHPFHSRPKRNYDNNKGHRREGWNHGRSYWRDGRGGGQQRDDRRERGEDWRGDRRGQRKPWNDRHEQGGRGDRRPRYE